MSAKSQLRQWVREQLELQDEIVLPDLSREAARVFGKDPEFVHQLMEDTLPELIYEIVSRVLRETRDDRILLGDTITTREGVDVRARRHSVFLNWYEHIERGHVKLMEMTREDLLEAAKEREERGQHELGIARLWRTIAEQLEGGQKVSTRFTSEEIERLQEGLKPTPIVTS